MSEKLDKGFALYFSPASIGRASGARCGACWKFIRTGACVEVEGDIEASKVCGLYVHGISFEKNPHFPITKVSKREAGYGDGDSHCVGCTGMAAPRESYSACSRVEGLVEQQGCCTGAYVKR